MKKNLGILLTTPPSYENTQMVMSLCEKAIEMGKNIEIFLLDDGVHNLNNEEFYSLINKGIKILCAIKEELVPIKNKEGILFESNFDITNIVSENYRLVTFA